MTPLGSLVSYKIFVLPLTEPTTPLKDTNVSPGRQHPSVVVEVKNQATGYDTDWTV